MCPRVSIVTPLHNKGPYVAETMRSVLSQTLAEWEMLVVENGSSDGGAEVVTEYANFDQRIRLLNAPSRVKGPGAARNFGLLQAEGEWVLFLDADDLLEPTCLQALLNCAAANDAASVIVGRSRDMHGGKIESLLREPAGWRQSQQAVLDYAFACAPWPVHSSMIRRTSLGKAKPWPEDLDAYPSEDSAFWFSLLLSARVAWSEDAAVVYRHVENGGRNRTPDIALWIEGLLRIISQNLAALRAAGGELTGQQSRNCLRMLEEKLWIARRTGATEAASAALQEAKRWLESCDDSLPFLMRRSVGIVTTLTISKASRRLGLSRISTALDL